MLSLPAPIPDVIVIEPRIFSDERGSFYESFNARRFEELTGTRADFVQDNHSLSHHNVLRGLHYQVQQPQGKLIHVVAGAILDVVVDLRRSSTTFGNWTSLILSSENRRQLWIPPGFAHGFVVLGEQAEVQYKVTAYWAPQHERCIRWDDPTLAIDWSLATPPILSAKDRDGVAFLEAEVFP